MLSSNQYQDLLRSANLIESRYPGQCCEWLKQCVEMLDNLDTPDPKTRQILQNRIIYLSGITSSFKKSTTPSLRKQKADSPAQSEEEKPQPTYSGPDAIDFEDPDMDVFREFLATAADWAKLKSGIDGVFVVKIPATKTQAARLSIEVNPLDKVNGRPRKRKGLYLKSEEVLLRYRDALIVDGIPEVFHQMDPINQEIGELSDEEEEDIEEETD